MVPNVVLTSLIASYSCLSRPILSLHFTCLFQSQSFQKVEPNLAASIAASQLALCWMCDSPRTGRVWRTTPMWREQAEISWARCGIFVVAWCHSVQVCALAARPFQSQQSGALTRMPRWCQVQPSQRERSIGVVHCKNEGMLLQLLGWHCIESGVFACPLPNTWKWPKMDMYIDLNLAASQNSLLMDLDVIIFLPLTPPPATKWPINLWATITSERDELESHRRYHWIRKACPPEMARSKIFQGQTTHTPQYPAHNHPWTEDIYSSSNWPIHGPLNNWQSPLILPPEAKYLSWLFCLPRQNMCWDYFAFCGTWVTEVVIWCDNHNIQSYMLWLV